MRIKKLSTRYIKCSKLLRFIFECMGLGQTNLVTFTLFKISFYFWGLYHSAILKMRKIMVMFIKAELKLFCYHFIGNIKNNE